MLFSLIVTCTLFAKGIILYRLVIGLIFNYYNTLAVLMGKYLLRKKCNSISHTYKIL